MTVTLKVYEKDGSTHVDDLVTARRIRWVRDRKGMGPLLFDFSADEESSSSLIQTERIVKVNVDGRDDFAATVVPQRKSRTDSEIAGVRARLLGLRHLLTGVTVDPEGGFVDGGLRVGDTRLAGWMSSNLLFDHSTWTAAPTHGRVDSHPFFGRRVPALFPIGAAHLIGPAHTAGKAAPGWSFFRKSFTTHEPHLVRWIGTANDECVVYLQSNEILRREGEHQWDEFGASPGFWLPPGNHVVAAGLNNVERTTAEGGPNSAAWLVGALVLTNPDDQPDFTDETWTVDTNGATAGDFRLVFDSPDYAATGPIPHNAASATVQTALDDIIGPGKVTVTGSAGGPWTVVADGDDTSGVPHTLGYSLTGAALTGGATAYPIITNTVNGAYAEVLVKTDESWRHVAYPASTPGVTYGALVLQLLAEAAARGTVADVLTPTFTALVDSDGVAWADEVVVPMQVGQDLEHVLRQAEADGVLVGRFNPDMTFDLIQTPGTDLSATVELEWEADVTGQEHDRDGFRVDRLKVRTEAGWHEIEAAGAPADAREGFAAAGNHPDAGSFASTGQALLDRFSGQADVGVIKIPGADTSTPQPGVDFDLDDLITATSWQRLASKHEVLEIIGEVNDAGDVDWELRLGDTGVAP